MCEGPGQETVELAREKLPPEAREGDVVVLRDSGEAELDPAAAEERRRRIRERQRRLLEKNP